MKIVKNIILYLLFLLAMVLCGTIVIKIFDIILQQNYENIWLMGFKTGFIAWLFLSGGAAICKIKKNITKAENDKNAAN